MLPLLAVAASVFHWLGEKREKEDLEREWKELVRLMEEKFGKTTDCRGEN